MFKILYICFDLSKSRVERESVISRERRKELETPSMNVGQWICEKDCIGCGGVTLSFAHMWIRFVKSVVEPELSKTHISSP